MYQSFLCVVSEDRHFIESCRRMAENFGVQLRVYTPAEWQQSQQNNTVPSLSHGSNTVAPGENLIAFPQKESQESDSKRVVTMNELESEAIKKAIFEFKGNLTEAARALGIGRATLYRKVKQYGIDPSEARRKRSSAA